MTQVLFANGASPENLIDADDLLGDAFKTPDELRAEQDQQAQSQIDHLIASLNAVSLAAMFVGAQEKRKMLAALGPFAQGMALDVQTIDRIIDTLKANRWDDSDTKFFLELCQLLPPAPKFKPLSMRALLTMPPKCWLINQVLGAGDIGMIYGAPGCGKTFVVIDLIFAACLGQRFAMRFDIERPLNVAYAAGEGISGLPARFGAAAEFYQQADIPNFTFFAVTPQLYVGDASPLANSIIEFVNEWKQRQAEGQAQPLDILIIDTLHSATAGADENSAKDMGVVLKLAKDAATELGCAVLLVHHTNKTGTAERGSSALRGAMDTMIEIKRDANSTKATMCCEKLKDGEAWKSQTLDLVPVQNVDSVRVWWDLPSDDPQATNKQQGDVEEIISLLSSKPGTRYTAKAIAENIGMNPTSTQIFKLIKKAMAENEAIQSGLKHPDKDAHSTNPTMYWYSLTDSLTH